MSFIPFLPTQISWRPFPSSQSSQSSEKYPSIRQTKYKLFMYEEDIKREIQQQQGMYVQNRNFQNKRKQRKYDKNKQNPDKLFLFCLKVCLPSWNCIQNRVFSPHHADGLHHFIMSSSSIPLPIIRIPNAHHHHQSATHTRIVFFHCQDLSNFFITSVFLSIVSLRMYISRIVMLCYAMLCTYSILRTEYKTIYIKFYILFSILPHHLSFCPLLMGCWQLLILDRTIYITIGYTTFERESYILIKLMSV